MRDEAHRETDTLLDRLERRITEEYSTATEEMQKKAQKYFERFDAKDKLMLQKLKKGNITQTQYNDWRAKAMLTGKRYEALRDVLAKDCTNANKLSMNMVYGNMKDVYAINRNYGAFEVEKASQMDTSFTLYDRATVERLIRENPRLLPKPRVDIPKDLQWNRQKVGSALLQGVLQGESIPHIARRLQGVTDMNRSAAVRNARTMTTSAECAGRIDSYKQAEDMGIDLKQMWVATLDDRTRHEHRQLDGQQVAVGEKFRIAGYELAYPGDPAGAPEMVYNCRCTVIAVIPHTRLAERGLGSVTRASKLKDMSYEEWKTQKEKRK